MLSEEKREERLNQLIELAQEKKERIVAVTKDFKAYSPLHNLYLPKNNPSLFLSRADVIAESKFLWWVTEHVIWNSNFYFYGNASGFIPSSQFLDDLFKARGLGSKIMNLIYLYDEVNLPDDVSPKSDPFLIKNNKFDL